MNPARPLLAVLHWFARHLVAFGFVAFAALGWFWREELFDGRLDWDGLVVLWDSPAPAIDRRPGHDSIPKGAFRPIVPGLRAAPPEQRPDRLLSRARKAYWLDQPEVAEELYREYLAIHPDSVDAHGELGNLLLILGRDSEAESAYRRVIELLRRNNRSAEAARLDDRLAEFSSPRTAAGRAE